MLTNKQISDKVTSIGGRNKTLRTDIHVVLCNIAGQVYQNGDYRQLPRLLNNLQGHDKQAILAWVREFAFVRFTEKDGVVTYAVNANAKNRADFVDGDDVVNHLLEETPWYEFAKTTEQAVKALDPAQAVEALAKRIEKARAEGRPVLTSASALRDALIHLESVLKPAEVNTRDEEKEVLAIAS